MTQKEIDEVELRRYRYATWARDKRVADALAYWQSRYEFPPTLRVLAWVSGMSHGSVRASLKVLAAYGYCTIADDCTRTPRVTEGVQLTYVGGSDERWPTVSQP